MFQPYYNFQQPLYSSQSSYQNSYQQSVNLIRVTGYDGAKAYQMPPNSTTALFDSNDNLMYIKTTDGAGFPTIRTFRFEELRPTQMSVSNGDFISREDSQGPQGNKNLQATVAQMIKGKDPKEVFYEECKKRGANPEMILNLVKVFKK